MGHPPIRVVRSSERPTNSSNAIRCHPASDRKLLVGFSDDRRFFVQLLVLLVFFVLVIIIVGMSRRHRVTARDGDETPNVLGDTWSHFRLLCGCRVSWRC